MYIANNFLTGQIPTELSNLENLRSGRVMPNVITWSAGISACEEGGQQGHVLLLLERDSCMDVALGVFICNAGGSACENCGQSTQALLLEDVGKTERYKMS